MIKQKHYLLDVKTPIQTELKDKKKNLKSHNLTVGLQCIHI